MSNTLPGAFALPDKLTLDASDLETEVDDWLLIDNKLYEVDVLNKTNIPWIATISSPTSDPMPASGTYVRPITTGGRMAPFMNLNPATNGDWDAGAARAHPAHVSGRGSAIGRPARHSASRSATSRLIVVLGEEFQAARQRSGASSCVDAAVGEWQRLLGDTSTNPELSWEYWNGKGWWKLDVTRRRDAEPEERAARVRFKVPADIASTDWAGKTNYWIRARLIGGDYGREKVTVQVERPSARAYRADGRALVRGHPRAVGRASSASPTASATASSRRSC